MQACIRATPSKDLSSCREGVQPPRASSKDGFEVLLDMSIYRERRFEGVGKTFRTHPCGLQSNEHLACPTPAVTFNAYVCMPLSIITYE
jgi:hypothetical protein